MTQTIMPDDEIVLTGQDIIDLINGLQSTKDDLIEQNRKLNELFTQNERKIICFNTGIEIINQLISKANMNKNKDITMTTNIDKDNKYIKEPSKSSLSKAYESSNTYLSPLTTSETSTTLPPITSTTDSNNEIVTTEDMIKKEDNSIGK